MQSKTERLLFLDIEWSPAIGYVWGMWQQNMTPDKLIDHGGMLCFCAHWGNEREFMFFSEWEHGRKGMAEAALKLLTEADAVVTYNGDRYDLPKITGEILLANLSPPPMPTSIDVIKTIKKMGFNMNRLAYIGPLLGLGGKVKHQGFNLWKDVLAGDEKARRTMTKYCIQDVRLLKKLYERVKPFIRNHPFLGATKHDCGTCGKDALQSRGYRRTKTFKIRRHQCVNCGAWQDGTREKIK